MGHDAPAYMSMTGEHQVLVVGWIRYSDGAGMLYRTGFCRVYTGAVGMTSARFRKSPDEDYEYEDW